MAVRMINCAIRQVIYQDDLCARVDANEEHGVFVCDATEDEWRQYVQSESQVLKSRTMVWRPLPEQLDAVRRGSVYIVELSTGLHETVGVSLFVALLRVTGTRCEHLVGHGSSYVAGLHDFSEPDQSFGPDRRVPGAALPPELTNWAEFHTLKVEIGVSRGWSQLMQKAEHWATIPGVAYVLLIRISRCMRVRQYGVLEVHRPVDEAPVLVPIVPPQTAIQADPTTTIRLDARRLLGLQPADTLPPGFAPSGVVVINLEAVVEDAIGNES